MKATFDDALAFLQAREGTSVYIEIGMRDPTLENSDFFPIKMHTELGTLRIGEDVGHGGRGVAAIPFGSHDRNRLFLDVERVSEVLISGDAMKVHFHDAIYLGVTGGPASRE